jgi:hypothetical protein
MTRTSVGRWAVQLAAGTAAQVLLATATASAAPVAQPCRVPAAPPALAQPAVEHEHHDGPVRRGDSCTVPGQTAYAQPGMRLVTCARHRGLNHLTWG